jgi:hypothetical protein
MRIKLPENCLRNSYATYALTFRSIGEVAKAMGDAESTLKRFYVQTLEPGVGHEWFRTARRSLAAGALTFPHAHRFGATRTGW